jgi:hypothetical protein
MFDPIALGREFFAMLVQIDEEITQMVAAGGCRLCAGPLHRGDYQRKPRGALIAAAGEEFVMRFSLCCGTEGCRKRATPPSLRFLGRRVYLGAVVIVASIVAQVGDGQGVTKAIREATGVPERTVRRWGAWWLGPFLATEVWTAVRARILGVSATEVPASIVDRLVGGPPERVQRLLEWLRPLTTGTGVGSRSVRDTA